ncbi:hypothetical protein B0J17DRAFT_116949 [Rhizoctonia solani]|nr:hypothetical protein B0J17DRAFT_116949 [Rhizoctonia solani]
MGDILVVYFVPRHRGASRYGDAVIWNWRSGTLLGRILSETYGTAPTFFDKDHLLFYSFPPSSSVESGLARSNQVGLLIYRIPTTATIIHQEPPNADAHVPSYPSLEPTLILEFPKLHSGYRVHEHTLLDTLADQGDVAYRGLAEVAYSHISTVALRLSVAQKEGKKGERRPTTHYSIHVNLDFLPSYLSENQAKEITRVPWAQWGVASTRWFIDNTAVNHGTTYGSLHLRFFCADNTTQLLTLLVFDPHIISRQTPHVLDEIEQQKVLEGQGLAFMNQQIDRRIASNIKTVIHTGFEEPVESTLPFMIVNRIQAPIHEDWYIHGEYLVGGPSRSLNYGDASFSLYKLQFSHEN